jgi:hypothetical protein
MMKLPFRRLLCSRPLGSATDKRFSMQAERDRVGCKNRKPSTSLTLSQAMCLALAGYAAILYLTGMLQ